MQRPLFNKAEAVLESRKLDITKAWLGRLIFQIEDLSTLEAFPTQESIRISVELIEGIAAVMRDDGMIREFQPGGRYYVRAAELGAIGNGSRGELVSLSQSLLALESSIWELLVETLRKEDRDLLATPSTASRPRRPRPTSSDRTTNSIDSRTPTPSLDSTTDATSYRNSTGT
jgi:hypothetical protein